MCRSSWLETVLWKRFYVLSSCMLFFCSSQSPMAAMQDDFIALADSLFLACGHHCGMWPDYLWAHKFKQAWLKVDGAVAMTDWNCVETASVQCRGKSWQPYKQWDSKKVKRYIFSTSDMSNGQLRIHRNIEFPLFGISCRDYFICSCFPPQISEHLHPQHFKPAPSASGTTASDSILFGTNSFTTLTCLPGRNCHLSCGNTMECLIKKCCLRFVARTGIASCLLSTSR